MRGNLLNPTTSKEQILKLLALYEVLTSRDLSLLINGNDDHYRINAINKTLAILDERHHLVNRIYFRPEKYNGRGNLPNAAGLSEEGIAYAKELWPETYPKEFPRTHSPHTIEHDLRRARTHIEIAKLANEKGWQIGWEKGDAHLLKPDDVFELTKVIKPSQYTCRVCHGSNIREDQNNVVHLLCDGIVEQTAPITKTAHFFLEEEYKRKDFDKLYKKFQPYVNLHGSGKMKDEWGFRYYTVIIPMRDTDAMTNALVHFQGSCNCVDRKLKKMHAGAPFKLQTDILAFTTHQDLMDHPGEPILHTTTGKTLSIMDIVK